MTQLQQLQRFKHKISMAELQQLIGRGDPTILELGAHNGSDTIDFIEAFPRGTVHCFECDPRPIAQFKNNLRLQALARSGRVVLHEFAISDAEGEHEFYQSGGRPNPTHHVVDWDYSSSLLKPTGHLQMSPWCKFDKKITVPTRTLDAWYNEYARRLPPLFDLVWSDLQGAEHLMIKGGQSVLNRTRYLYEEFYDTPMYEGQQNMSQLLSLLGPSWRATATYEGYNFLAVNNAVKPAILETSHADA